MEAVKKTDDVMTSAAAFVEGGVQEACDDACSICLDDFSQGDPSTVTNCKHEFHLHCILEWCQRSSNCPMCWQPISLRDETSQQLLEAVEEEKNLMATRLRNAEVFRRRSLADFDLRHALQIPDGTSDIVLEDHIFQHLAAAAMGRNHHIFRREGQGNWSSSERQRPFFIFSEPSQDAGSESEADSPGSTFTSHRNRTEDEIPTSVTRPQSEYASVHRVRSNVESVGQQPISSRTRSFASRSPEGSRETGEQSDLQSFSESVRSRLNSWSIRYRDSFSRNTIGLKERLFSRTSSMADVRTEARREVNAGLAGVSRLMERLNVRENAGSVHSTRSRNSSSRNNTNNSENPMIQMRERKVSTPCPGNSTTE